MLSDDYHSSSRLDSQGRPRLRYMGKGIHVTGEGVGTEEEWSEEMESIRKEARKKMLESELEGDLERQREEIAEQRRLRFEVLLNVLLVCKMQYGTSASE